MKNMRNCKKSMRVLLTILISLVCINGALMIGTIISSAATASDPEVGVANNNGATKVSETVTAVLTEKFSNKANQNDENMQSREQTVKKNTKSSDTQKNTVAKTATKSTTKSVATTKTTSTKSKKTSSSGISSLRSSVNRSLMNAFDELEFVIKVNPKATYLGYFSTSKHSLEMREVSIGTFRHEMGHFLDVLKNMPSKTSEFASIYKKEKGDYSGTNAAYITKNAQEYFAQSYRNYLENGSKLKSERPQTYTFIQKQVSNITSTDIKRTYNMYSWSW